jgi:predicted  nucleic acid-binding Zn-ribbon protein
MNSLKKDFIHVKKEFDNLEEYLRKNKNKIQSEIIAEVNYYIKDIKTDIDEIQDDIHKIQEDIRKFPELIKENQEEIEDIREDIEDIREEIANIKTDIVNNNYNDDLKRQYSIQKLDREKYKQTL